MKKTKSIDSDMWTQSWIWQH